MWPADNRNTNGKQFQIINEGLNGVLTGDSVQTMAKAIIALVENKKLQNHMRKNARKSILSYDFKNIAEVYLAPLYQAVLA